MCSNVDREAGRGLERLGLGSILIALCLIQADFSRPAIAGDENFVDGLAAYDAGDVAETVRIWKALADGGDPNAQVGLAGLYRAGTGVPRDPVEAARLYRLAAERGDSNGQLNLGRLYLEGVGVDQDPAAAYVWLTLAGRQGRRWAEEQRLAIEPTLSDAERTAAEALIGEVDGR